MRRRLEEFAAEVFAPLVRRDQRDKGATYVRGLLLDGRRKSMQPMAERLGVDHQGLQQFLSSSTWAVEPVRERLAHRAVEVVAPVAWVVDLAGRGSEVPDGDPPRVGATVGVGDPLRSRSALDALGLPTTGRLHPLRPRDGTQLLTERRRPRPSGWEDEGLRACGTRRGQGRDPQRGPGILWTTSRPCWRATVAAGVKRASPESEPEPDEAAFRFRK